MTGMDVPADPLSVVRTVATVIARGAVALHSQPVGLRASGVLGTSSSVGRRRGTLAEVTAQTACANRDRGARRSVRGAIHRRAPTAAKAAEAQTCDEESMRHDPSRSKDRARVSRELAVYEYGRSKEPGARPKAARRADAADRSARRVSAAAQPMGF
jgi:hypothetical protein